MKINFKLAAALGCGCFLFVALYIDYPLAAGEDKVRPVEIEQVAPAGLSSIGHQNVHSQPAGLENPAEPLSGNNLLAGFYDDNVYAAVMRERSQGGPGSRMRVVAFTQPCLEFWDKEERGAASQNPNHAEFAKRVRAREILARRCNQASLNLLYQAQELAPGDSYGQRTEQALDALTTVGVARPKVEAAMRELIEQGSPGIPLSKNAPLIWMGESWADRREEYRQAFDWAQRLATSLPGRESDDIRLLGYCYVYGYCNDQYDFGAHRLSPDRYEAVKKLAYDMKDALQRKDATPFLSAPK